MFKKIFIAASVLMAGFVTVQPIQSAEARVNVDIGVYVPLRPRYRTYDPYYTPPRRRPRARRISCGRGRNIVARHQYYSIRAVDCRGSQYRYHAKRDGRWYYLNMNSRTGRITGVHFLYR